MPMFSRKKKKVVESETHHARPRRRTLSDVHPAGTKRAVSVSVAKNSEPEVQQQETSPKQVFPQPPIVVSEPIRPSVPVSDIMSNRQPVSTIGSSSVPAGGSIGSPSISEQVPRKPAEAMFLSPKPQEPLIQEIRESRPRRRGLVALIAGLAIIGGLVWYTAWRTTLTITILPKELRYDLGDKGLQVTFDAEVFSSALLKRGEGQSMESKKFSEKAHGTIVIFNAFNSSPQVLVVRTRFESPSGKIYRLERGVTVPAMRDGRPGSVEATVVADASGPDYNSGLTDFTIPGFKGSPKFDKFYARSKTEMTGGASGEGKLVGQKEASELLSRLEGEMLVELQKNFEASVIPKSSVTFPEKIEYKVVSRVTDPAVGSPAEKFFEEVRGEARTLAIAESVYSDVLAKVALKDQYKSGTYVLKRDNGITISAVSFDYEKKQIKATLAGKAIFQGVVPKDELRKKALESADYEALKGIFASYPGIAKAEAVFRPSFFKRIPRNPDRLTITIQ